MISGGVFLFDEHLYFKSFCSSLLPSSSAVVFSSAATLFSLLLPMASPSTLNKLLLWLSLHPAATRLVPILFAPAAVALLTRVLQNVDRAVTAPAFFIALALLLFCIELAWMAHVDLRNVAVISADVVLASAPSSVSRSGALEEKAHSSPVQTTAYASLNRFFVVATSTIVLELVGFYAAFFFLPLGGLFVITSQIWFNVLAGVQLFPKQPQQIVPFGISRRIDVLAANGVAIGCLCLWPVAIARLPASVGLLVLIVLFLVLKYGPLFYTRIRSRQ